MVIAGQAAATSPAATSERGASSAEGLRPVCISGLATYVPPRLLTNDDLERMVDTNHEWILQRTGISERHIVDPGVATSDLAKEAAIKALAQAGIGAGDIGFIIVGTTTPDMMFPSTACLLQHKIGATRRVGLRPRRRVLRVHLRADDGARSWWPAVRTTTRWPWAPT